MADLIKFSDAVNLGFHAMIQLTVHGELPLRQIAESLEVSEAHLSKVMQALRKRGLVDASRGPSGGYRLSRDPKEIALADVFVALEGPIDTKTCLFKRPVCAEKCCGLGAFVGQLGHKLKTYLEKTTLAQVKASIELAA